MHVDRIEATYKRADRSGYPELDGYAWADIYEVRSHLITHSEPCWRVQQRLNTQARAQTQKENSANRFLAVPRPGWRLTTRGKHNDRTVQKRDDRPENCRNRFIRDRPCPRRAWCVSARRSTENDNRLGDSQDEYYDSSHRRQPAHRGRNGDLCTGLILGR